MLMCSQGRQGRHDNRQPLCRLLQDIGFSFIMEISSHRQQIGEMKFNQAGFHNAIREKSPHVLLSYARKLSTSFIVLLVCEVDHRLKTNIWWSVTLLITRRTNGQLGHRSGQGSWREVVRGDEDDDLYITVRQQETCEDTIQVETDGRQEMRQ
ncbi:hypothetical protein RRG08_002718 [Elysia crispata]|uniref:Uncharacterized protein n=1 Tax=Elysia crispata TaxID=231223 RepID=A0AAE1CMM8_9GAST|nr:hypothetical protein RRG08_002718 [Elysia crispata]